jgi:hypothetical protein
MKKSTIRPAESAECGLHLYDVHVLPIISFPPNIFPSQVITLFSQNIMQHTYIVTII